MWERKFNLLPSWLWLFLGLCFPCLPEAELLQKFSTTLQGGVQAPIFNLEKYLNPGPSAGISLNTPYYQYMEARLTLHYALYRTKDRAIAQRLLGVTTAGVFLVLAPHPLWLPRTGLGLISSTATSTSNSEGLLLDDKETEFGLAPLLYWAYPLTPISSLELGAEWDTIWSRPQYTHLTRFYFGVRLQWW